MQVLNALLEDVRLDFKYSAAAQSSCFSIKSIQIDNQLLTSSHHVVLAPTLTSLLPVEVVGVLPPTVSLVPTTWCPSLAMLLDSHLPLPSLAVACWL